MSESKLNNDLNLMDLMIRLSVIERVLLEKNIVSKDEIISISKNISKEILKEALKQSGVTDNLENILSEFDK